MDLRASLPAIPGLLLATGLLLAGCAAPTAPGPQQASAAPEFNDPYENTNRAVFDFNQGVSHRVLIPVAKTYRTVVPQPVRQNLHDFLQNLDGPVVFMNDLLQGQVKLAGNTMARFLFNTTVGMGGIIDVASRLGIPYHDNDFGVTLAVWGVPDGPYIVVPVLGPSNPRDITGMVVDGLADPGNNVSPNLLIPAARTFVHGEDTLSRNIESLEDLEKTSLDYYATIRSIYRQRREAQINHVGTNLPNPVFGGSDGGDAGLPAIQYTIPEGPKPPQVPPR
jgi:phospholipid-binding lipoprotein MlaA